MAVLQRAEIVKIRRMAMSFYFRSFLSAIVIFLVTSFFGAQKSEAETYRVYGIVSSDVLYIRSRPSSRGAKIGSIPPYGKGVHRLGPCRGSWCKISYLGMIGWASMKYLTLEAPAGSSYRVRGIKSWDVLFIRVWPSAKSKKVGSIPPDGRGVGKLGPCKGNWCKISYRGITGWASMMYLVADRMASAVVPAYRRPPPQYRPTPRPAETAPIVPWSPPPDRNRNSPTAPRHAPPPPPEMYDDL
jgi:uncharacterized protein YraI